MSAFMLDRRKALLGVAAGALTAAAPRNAFAAGPGGFSRQRLARIPEALQTYVDDNSAVGMVTLLYRHGEIAQVNALGMQNRETNTPMQRNSMFRIASMSKPITVVAAMTLIEQGRFQLTDTIDRWLPELANRQVLNSATGPLNETHPAPRGITVLDLMTHRSGLAYNFTARGPLQAAYENNIPPEARNLHPPELTVDEFLRRISTVPLAFDPGTQWLYGHSTDVLGALVSRVSGMSYGDYLKQTIFDPLGMNDTGFWMPNEKQGRIAAVYGRDASGARSPVELPIPNRPLAFGSGGGGLVSTADDYLKFARMLLGKGRSGTTRILSHRSVGLMTTDWLTPEQRVTPTVFGPAFFAGQGFGLNLGVVDHPSRLGAAPYASVGSFSWAGAYGTSWQVDPVEDMIYVFMVQNNNALVAPPRPGAAPPAAPPAPPAPRAGGLPAQPVVALVNMAYEAIDD